MLGAFFMPKYWRKKCNRKATIKAGPASEISFHVDDNLIRERAYGIWIAEGSPHGRDIAHWERAMTELLAA